METFKYDKTNHDRHGNKEMSNNTRQTPENYTSSVTDSSLFPNNSQEAETLNSTNTYKNMKGDDRKW